MHKQTSWFLNFIRTTVFLSVYLGCQTLGYSEASGSAKQELNSIKDLSSGKAPVPVVIDLLTRHDESRLLATVTIMHKNYWQNHAIITAVTERLPHWNDEKPEVYLAVMPKLSLISDEPDIFATLWLGLQTNPLLLRDIAAGLMRNQSKPRIEKIRQMLLATDGKKSQAIIEDASADATRMAMRSFDQGKMLALLKSGGLYQKNIVLLYLDSNWPKTIEPDLLAEIKGLAENCPVKSVSLLAGLLLSKHTAGGDGAVKEVTDRNCFDYIQRTGKLWGICEVAINDATGTVTLVDARYTGYGHGLAMYDCENKVSSQVTLKVYQHCRLSDGHHASMKYEIISIKDGIVEVVVTERFDARSFGKEVTEKTETISVKSYKDIDANPDSTGSK